MGFDPQTPPGTRRGWHGDGVLCRSGFYAAMNRAKRLLENLIFEI
jgi:hypothetical protein